MADPRTGALLLNLGTPDSPSVSDVRRYLREFLNDPRVIDIPALGRWLLLNLIILPFRPKQSAAAYAKIWTPEGSPLMVHSRALTDAVGRELGPDWVVELAMRYGQPSIASALERLREANVSQLVVLPLFPQYSEAATGSALAKFAEEMQRIDYAAPFETISAFYDAPGFTRSVASAAEEVLREFSADFVLFSYHGLPERHVTASDPSGAHCLASDDCCASVPEANPDCYRAQCFATTRAVAKLLDLGPERHATAFQSRLGRTPWIRPFTDHILVELAERGIRRLAVICPSFTADCLETLEEIGIRAAEQWRELCDGELKLIPAVNARPDWAHEVAEALRFARS
ncbi:MAG: ferrochelatase [Deltaproteobacteria bacterium]|jgi:ferrochelatase|nr:ferrochelatase [Deltaproteobacteria bacterium]